MMLLAKNFQNWPVFHGVIQKIKVARFLLRHGVEVFRFPCFHIWFGFREAI